MEKKINLRGLLYKGQKPFPLGVPISEVPLYILSRNDFTGALAIGYLVFLIRLP